MDHSIELPISGGLSVIGQKVQRIGLSKMEIVVLNQTLPGLFHGYVLKWDELEPPMRTALYKAGWVKNIKTGKMNWPSWAQ